MITFLCQSRILKFIKYNKTFQIILNFLNCCVSRQLVQYSIDVNPIIDCEGSKARRLIYRL